MISNLQMGYGRTLVRGFATSLLCAGLCAVAAADGPTMSLQDAKAALIGKMRGGSSCGRKIGTEFTFEEVAPAKAGFAVKGMYRTYDLPGQQSSPTQETPWAGTFDPTTATLELQSVLPPPPDPKACPKALSSVFGTKMQCSSSFLGPVGEKMAANKAKAAADLAMASRFVAAFARNANGDGWRGTLVNPAFDCPEVTLQDASASARALPPLSGDAAYAQADYFLRNGSPTTSGTSRVYWLKLATLQGNRDANAFLGRSYEFGEGAPQDYTLAAKYYRVAAEAGDARAQESLSELLAKGQGVPQNRDESGLWAKKALDTRRAAGQVCVAEAMVGTFQRLMFASMSDPTVKMTELLGGAFLGVDINSGTFRIISVTAQSISSLDRPFVCEVVARRLGVSITNLVPEWGYVGDTVNGDVVLHDQRFDARMNQMLAQGATNIMSAVPWIQSFRVSPSGGTRFQVLMQQQMFALSRDYSAQVDLNQTPAAVQSTPAVAQATRTPPVQVPAQGGTATGATDAVHGNAHMDDVVDSKLIQWASSWSFDRYAPGSAHVSKTDCNPSGCSTAGTFVFARGGAMVTAPFAGKFDGQTEAASLLMLCYTDPTNGQQDCTR